MIQSTNIQSGSDVNLQKRERCAILWAVVGRQADAGITRTVEIMITVMSMHTAGNIKFVYNRQPSASVTAPSETMTEGRVYVTLDRTIDKDTGVVTLGKPKYITFFDGERKRNLQYDIDGHFHPSKAEKKARRKQKIKEKSLRNSHSHKGYNHDSKSATLLTPEERSIAAKVLREWRKNVRQIKQIHPKS